MQNVDLITKSYGTSGQAIVEGLKSHLEREGCSTIIYNGETSRFTLVGSSSLTKTALETILKSHSSVWSPTLIEDRADNGDYIMVLKGMSQSYLSNRLNAISDFNESILDKLEEDDDEDDDVTVRNLDMLIKNLKYELHLQKLYRETNRDSKM